MIFYGLDPKADIWADEIQGKGLQGIQFRLHYQGNSMKLQVPAVREAFRANHFESQRRRFLPGDELGRKSQKD